jgi:hypothetical protein
MTADYKARFGRAATKQNGSRIMWSEKKGGLNMAQHDLEKDFRVISICRIDVAEKIYEIRDGMSGESAKTKAAGITDEQMEDLAHTLTDLYFEIPNLQTFEERLIEAYDLLKEDSAIP